jgi:hypothetical protein
MKEVSCIMGKTNMTVVRNAAYKRSELNVRERHNERKNESYFNGDVVPERSELNIHFKSCAGTYADEFDRLLSDGVISTRGQKPDAKIIDELVFDVNTNFFEERGGYEYAKKFYEAAYQLAVKEAGGKQFILSAVLHADERNKALSEQSGRDVFHYHLHVVYIPVVQKEILWTKRCKDPALVGTVKEAITQVSHSKKWPGRVTAERGFANSYSLLQDRFFEHMRSAGFDGFERGERGSTAEHLDVLDYKIQQDNKRLDVLDERVEKKEAKLERLDEKITVREKAKATIAEVEAMGKPALLGGFNMTAEEVKKLKSLAKKSVTIENRNAEWKKRIAALEQQLTDVKQELNAIARDRDYWRGKFKDLEKMVKPYITAIINFPQELSAFISRHWQERQKSRTQEVTR